MLDIIIAQYKETEDIIKNLLDSINNQKNIDFNELNLTIINDYSDIILSDEFLSSYNKLKINYYKNDKNVGIGLTRQRGIELTNDKYFMFIDSDDTLYDDYSLEGIINYLKKSDIDVLITNIAVELDNKIIIKKKNNTFPWMHGKIYRREFIFKNELRFSDKVIHLDDAYFNNCMLGVVDPNKIVFLDITTYLWKDNNKSITREKREIPYAIMIFDEIYNTANYIYDYLCKHKSNKRFSHYISSTLNRYILLNSDLFDKFNDKKEYYLEKLKKELLTNIFKMIKKDNISLIYEYEKNSCIDRYGITNIYKTIDDFYNDFKI